MSKTQGFQINWLASTGSALGAVSSAVLLSTLGAAGTIFGAALGSLIITVGGSFYTQSLQKGKDRVVSVRVGEKRAAPSQGSAATSKGSHVVPSTSVETEAAPKKSLPWKRIIGLSVGLFVAAMAVILVFEVTAGRPLSSFTGGSDTNSGTTFSKLAPSSGKTDEPDAGETDAPKEEELAEEKPEEKDPADEKPAEEKPAEEKPAEEKPADPPPAEEPPAEAPPADTDE